MKITLWQRVRAWFKDSETIFLARLQMLAGILAGAWLTIDPSLFGAYMPPEWLPIYLFAAGIITEVARRYRAKDL